MRHLALISYFYPPDGGGGTQRAKYFADHLSLFGWLTTVFTRNEPNERSRWDPADESLVGDNGDGVEVVRVPVPYDSRAQQMVPAPGSRLDPWLGKLAARIMETHHCRRFDAAVVTMPPYGLAPLVSELKRIMPELPVLVDLRDPWGLDGAPVYSSRREWMRGFQWMVRTIGQADGVIVNTPEARQQICKAVPGVPADRIRVITNGYEESNYRGALGDPPMGYEPGGFHLVHTGTFHSEALLRQRGVLGWLRRIKQYRAEPIDVSGRTPVHLLQAIRMLREQKHPMVDNLLLVLVGVDDPATRQLVEDSGVGDCVRIIGYVPHDVSISWTRWADCLFLPLHGLPAGRRSLIVPGKTYECLASGRPILGCLPAGDARELVERSERGFCADPCDPLQIAGALGRVLDLAAEKRLPSGPPEPWVSRFARRQLTQQFAAVLNEAIGEPAAAETGVVMRAGG